MVRHITTLSCHGGFVIGSDMSGGVRNVLAQDCVFDGSDRGIRLKSNSERGGMVENITYRNITMRRIKGEAIRIETNYGAWLAATNATAYPMFRNISFQDIVCDGAATAASIQGSAHQPVENLTLERVSIKARAGMKFDWVRGLRLRQVTSTPASGQPLSFENCQDVVEEPAQ